jgi:Tfp pilus assembly protein PilF
MAESIASQGTYREFQTALQLLHKNHGEDGTAGDEDLDLEVQLLSARPEPASWQQAVDLIDKLEERRPLTTGRRLTRAQLREKLGQWAAARDELVVLVAKPETPPAYVALLVEKLIEHGETSSARTWLRRLERSTPDSALAMALNAKLAMAENDREKAIEFARQLMPGQDVPIDQPAQLNAVAKLMEDLGFEKAADRVFQQYAAIAGEGILARIGFLSRQGRSEEALDLIEQNWDALSLERALALATEVIRARPDDAALATASPRVAAWIEKGKRVDPGSIVIKLLDAELQTLLGRDAEAESVYRDLLKTKNLSPAQSAIIANNLAFHLAKPETAAEADSLINKAIDELGPLPDLLDTRGLVRLASQDPAGAVEDLRLATLAPSAAKFLHLASAELAAGNDAAAREAFEKAQKEGLARMRLPALDAERLEQLEQNLGPAAEVTAATEG